MAIPYQVRSCKNPCGTAGHEYASCQAVKSGDYDFDSLAADISNATTMTKADAIGVLTAIKHSLKQALLSGQRIVLDELGALQMGIRSHCFDQTVIGTRDFDPQAYIQGVKIKFRPEAELLKYVRLYAKTKRVSSSLMD